MAIWHVGIDSWIIEDGNYRHFSVGDERSFALEYFARNGLSRAIDGQAPAAARMLGAMYSASGVVVRSGEWNVIDFGVLAYAQTRGFKAQPGQSVAGEIFLGIDHFSYFESFSKEPGAPALMYDWRVVGIEEDTTPWIEIDGRMAFDESRRSWAKVGSTAAGTRGQGESFVLHCELIGGPWNRPVQSPL